MTRFDHTMPRDYFEALYTEHPDPWRFASSPYEAEKYAATVAALGDRRFTAALEIGCSIGVLTEKVAARCNHLLALDVSETALVEARRRCAGLTNVTFARQQIPAEWPGGSFDLILLSEVVYYLDPDDIRRLARLTDAALTADGIVLLVHWTGETEYPVTGDDAVRLYSGAAFPRLIRRSGARTSRYRLDLMSRPPS